MGFSQQSYVNALFLQPRKKAPPLLIIMEPVDIGGCYPEGAAWLCCVWHL
jgi:hypothetical protein